MSNLKVFLLPVFLIASFAFSQYESVNYEKMTASSFTLSNHSKTTISPLEDAISAYPADSTSTVRPNNIFIECFGLGYGISVNYDTRFGNRRNGLGALIGIGLADPIRAEDGAYSIPFSVNYLFGKQKHFFELGLGGTFSNRIAFNSGDEGDRTRESLFGQTISLLYRRQPITKGVFVQRWLNPNYI